MATSISNGVSVPHPSPNPPSGFLQLSPSLSRFIPRIETSPNDDRAYRLVRLANGLEALIISDPKTDKACAALDVAVGHFSDPDDLPGCAHFVEHAVHLGSEKFPVEDEYKKYLAAHAGSSNASTGQCNTTYHCLVEPSALPGALSRFAQFFIAPLFPEDAISRERNGAVDSENKKNLQSDIFRLYQLQKGLAKSGHPLRKFATGNRQTLGGDDDGRDVRGEIYKWWKEKYDARVMKLVLIGKDSLDQLEELVAKEFSAVRTNGTATRETFPPDIWAEGEQRSQVFVETIKDMRQMRVFWPFPADDDLWKSKPGSLLSHLLGHESRGSLLSTLRSRSLATGIFAGVDNRSPGYSLIYIHISLTPLGLARYSTVLELIFAYLKQLKSEPIPQRIWAVNRVLDLERFRWREKTRHVAEYARELARGMQEAEVPRELLLSARTVAQEWAPEVLQRCLDGLGPERCRVVVASRERPEGVGELGLREKWYGTKYRFEPIPEEVCQKMRNQAPVRTMHLPEPNPFVSEGLQAPPTSETPAKRPSLIRDTELVRLWYKKDDRWGVPKANVVLRLRSPLAYVDPAHSAKTRLFAGLVEDSLVEPTYQAQLAGLSYSLSGTSEGLHIRLGGYDPKLPLLLRTVLEAAHDLATAVDAERFEIVKDQIARAYRNVDKELPNHIAGYKLAEATSETYWSSQEKLQALEGVTLEGTLEFGTRLLARLHVEALVHGNMSAQTALDVGSLVEDVLKPSALTAKEKFPDRGLIVPEGASLYVWPVPDPDNVNSALRYYLEVGASAPRTRALAGLFAQVARQPAFNTLRTQEQLGYIVSSSRRVSEGRVGWFAAVQSEHEPSFVESRIEAFLQNVVKDRLERMTEEEFEVHRQSWIKQVAEEEKNLGEESSLYWGAISNGEYDFLRTEKEVMLASSLTLSDLRDFFLTHIHPASPSRRKLAIHLVAHRYGPPAASDIAAFRGRCELAPRPQPVEPLQVSKL